jgi:hypothetical protein
LNDLFSIAGVAVAATLTIALLWAARRANELFVIRVIRGIAVHTRGRLPPALFSAIAEVVARPPVEQATLCVVLRNRVPTLEVRGTVPEHQRQQLRNVLGQFPAARIRSGRIAARASARN